MHVRIKPPRHRHVLAKLLSSEPLEPLLAEREPRLNELGVRSLAQGVRDDGLVLLGRDRASRVDDVAALLRVGRDRVDRAEDELFLEVREESEVALRLFRALVREGGREGETHLVDLDALILADDPRTTARCVEEHAIEPSNNLGELAPIHVRDDDVPAPQPRDVTTESLDPTPTAVVRPDFARVAHERTHVGRLTSWCGRHVEDAFVRLRSEGDDGEEGGSGLKDVVACKVFGGSACKTGMLDKSEGGKRKRTHRRGLLHRRRLGDRLCSILPREARG